MDNKLSELSKPVMYVVRTPDGSVALVKNYKYTAPKGFTSNPLYSQEYVSAMLADNEAKDKRIAELEKDELATRASSRAVHEAQENHINQQQDRIDSLEKKNAGLGRWLAAVEKQLAAPVRFPDCDTAAVSIMAHWLSDEEVNAWVKGIEFAKQQIRAAGFTVEGDE